jgi:hypothetical protein
MTPYRPCLLDFFSQKHRFLINFFFEWTVDPGAYFEVTASELNNKHTEHMSTAPEVRECF